MAEDLIRGEKLRPSDIFGKGMGKDDPSGDTFSIDVPVPSFKNTSDVDKDSKILQLQQGLLPEMRDALVNENYDLYEELAKKYTDYNKKFKDESLKTKATDELSKVGRSTVKALAAYKNKKSNDKTKVIAESKGVGTSLSDVVNAERPASTSLKLYKQGKEISSANEKVNSLKDRYVRAKDVLHKYETDIPDDHGNIRSVDQTPYMPVRMVSQDNAIRQQQALVDKIGAELDEVINTRSQLPRRLPKAEDEQSKNLSARERYSNAKSDLKAVRSSRDDNAKNARENIARTKLGIKVDRLGRMEHDLAPGDISGRTSKDLRLDDMLDTMFHYTKSNLNKEEFKQASAYLEPELEFDERLGAQRDEYKEHTGQDISPLDPNYNKVKVESVGLKANNAAVTVIRNTAEKMLAQELLGLPPEQVQIIRDKFEKQNKTGKYDTLLNALDENSVKYAPGESMLLDAYDYLHKLPDEYKGSQQRNVFYSTFNNEVNRLVALTESALSSNEVKAAREYASLLGPEARAEAKANEIRPIGADRVATVHHYSNRSGFDYGFEVSTKGGSEGTTGNYLGRVVSDVNGNKWFQVYSAIPRSDAEVADVKAKHRGKGGAKDAIWVESHQANIAEDPIFFTPIEDGTDVKQAVEKAKMYLGSSYKQISGKYTARAQGVKDAYKEMAGKAEGMNFTDFIKSEGIDPTDGSPRNLQRVLNYLRKMHDDMGLMVDQKTHTIYQIDNAPVGAVDWWDTYHNAKLAYIQETRNAQKSRVFKPDNPMSKAIRALVTKPSYGQGAIDYTSDKAKEKTKNAEEAQKKSYLTNAKQQRRIDKEETNKLKKDPLAAAFFAQYGK